MRRAEAPYRHRTGRKASWGQLRDAQLPPSDRRGWLRWQAALTPIALSPQRRRRESQWPGRRGVRSDRPRGRCCAGARSDTQLDRACRRQQGPLDLRTSAQPGLRHQRDHDPQPAAGVAGRADAVRVDGLRVLRHRRLICRVLTGGAEHSVRSLEIMCGDHRASTRRGHFHERPRQRPLRRVGHFHSLSVHGTAGGASGRLLRGRVLLPDLLR